MLLERTTETFLAGLTESVVITSSPDARHNHKRNQEPLNTNINTKNDPQYKLEIVWMNALVLFLLHLVSVYGVWLMITQIKWRTFIFFNVSASIVCFGITAGVHRLWSHRSYKAKLPLRIFLMLCFSATHQSHIYEWARDHRVHHKYADTDGDPHNASRGLFFSHMGWLMVKKHKDVFVKGKTVDLTDLEADPVVMFQKKYYWPLAMLLGFIIPVSIPCYFWGEGWWLSWIVVGMTRYAYILNITCFVNSLAHAYGTKPYDKYIKSVETKFVAWVAYGEGWHNYHHAFPWDYKTAELGNYKLNVTTAFIDFMAKLGLAYDLKTASPEIVKRRVQRTGDGSWNGTIGYDHHHIDDDNIWGWGDVDMKSDDIKCVEVCNKLLE